MRCCNTSIRKIIFPSAALCYEHEPPDWHSASACPWTIPCSDSKARGLSCLSSRPPFAVYPLITPVQGRALCVCSFVYRLVCGPNVVVPLSLLYPHFIPAPPFSLLTCQKTLLGGVRVAGLSGPADASSVSSRPRLLHQLAAWPLLHLSVSTGCHASPSTPQSRVLLPSGLRGHRHGLTSRSKP